MGFFGSNDGAAKIEADIRSMEKRRATLEGRLASSVAAAKSAARAALDNLVTGNGDEDITAQTALEATAREARRTADALASALTEIDSRLEVATANLRAARDSEVRERRAAEMEGAATAVVKRAKELEKAADALGNAFEAFVRDIPPDALALKIFDRKFAVGNPIASPTDIARAIVAQSLYVVSPEMFETAALPQDVAPAHIAKALILRHVADSLVDHRLWGLHGEEVSLKPATIAAEEMLVEPLRRMARALRENRSQE